jgi:hypothetical protein
MLPRAVSLLALTLMTGLGSAPRAAVSEIPDWETSVWLPPFVTIQSAEEGTRGSALWPFFHWSRVGSEVEWGLRPLINWRRNRPEDRLDVDLLWPLFKYDLDGEQFDWRLFPLFGGWEMNQSWGDPDRYFTIFPILWMQRDPTHSNVVIPPYMRLRETEEGGLVRFDAVFPFWVGSDERTGESTRSLFPVIWGKREGELSYLVIFPLYWDTEHFLGVMPIWGEYLDRNLAGEIRERHRLFLPPLWIDSEWPENHRRRHNILWPLIAMERSDHTSLFRILPLFSRQIYSQSGREYESRDLLVFPLLISRHYQAEELYERRITMPPYWWWWGPDLGDRRVSSWGIYPLIHGHSTEGEGNHLSLFDPLFFLEDREVHDRLSILWKLFDHRASADGEEVETQLLWRVFHRERRGENLRLKVAPFITLEREPGRTRTAFLWRVFELTREPAGRFIRVLFSPRLRIGGGTETPQAESQP